VTTVVADLFLALPSPHRNGAPIRVDGLLLECFLRRLAAQSISICDINVFRPDTGFRTKGFYVLYRTTVRTVLERNQRREAEIKKALRQEATRHEAAVKSMHRLRALRLQHDKKAKGT
jgi:hypothetical protein